MTSPCLHHPRSQSVRHRSHSTHCHTDSRHVLTHGYMCQHMYSVRLYTLSNSEFRSRASLLFAPGPTHRRRHTPVARIGTHGGWATDARGGGATHQLLATHQPGPGGMATARLRAAGAALSCVLFASVVSGLPQQTARRGLHYTATCTGGSACDAVVMGGLNEAAGGFLAECCHRSEPGTRLAHTRRAAVRRSRCVFGRRRVHVHGRS